MDLKILFIGHSRFMHIEENLKRLEDIVEIEKEIYIDGTTDETIKNEQEKFVKKNCGKFKIKRFQENFGVRLFIPKAISESFKNSTHLLIIEDDILISENSIKFIYDNREILKNNIISLFTPVFGLNNNVLSFDGGIWGWCVSKKNWDKFHWSDDTILKIFNNTRNKIGLLRSLFFTPLFFMSSRGLIKSWAYNWYYIRLIFNIKSYMPMESLSQNLGIGTLDATNTKRKHKHSKVLISSKLTNKYHYKDLKLVDVLGYSLVEIYLRLVYNWFCLLKFKYLK